jgi:hypothetical protein
LEGIESLKRPRTPDSDIEDIYVRKPYVRKPYVRRAPIVTHSKPREKAGHVYRRENRVTTALPPPSSKHKGSDGSAGGDREQEEDNTREGNENSNNGGDGNDENDKGKQPVVEQHNHEESDDDFASVASSPWPEEIWNDVPSDEVLASLEIYQQALAERHKAELEEARRQGNVIGEGSDAAARIALKETGLSLAKQQAKFREQENLEGPGWRIFKEEKFGIFVYQLFVEEDTVWRYIILRPPPDEQISVGKKISLEDLGRAGWYKVEECGRCCWMSFNEEGRLETIPPLPARLEDIPLLRSEELRDICSRG